MSEVEEAAGYRARISEALPQLRKSSSPGAVAATSEEAALCSEMRDLTQDLSTKLSRFPDDLDHGRIRAN